jgi:3-oxoacyl-[acyl-carrier-protein] synthase-3
MKPRIIGTGWAVPETIRRNDDPIFDWLRANHPAASNFFDGYDARHVLKPGEGLIDIMLPAAQMALKTAGKKPEDIDLLLGLGSISEYVQPNMLSQLHNKLGLPENCWVIPIGNDYSNYGSCLLLADGLLRAKRAKNILICIGGNWTTNVDYKTPQSVSAADGAGAAVMSLSSDKAKFRVKDHYTVTASENYGQMFTKGLPLENYAGKGQGRAFSPGFFQITEQGLKEFQTFGMEKSITSVTKLLENNGLNGSDISFMPHQTSKSLMDYWNTRLTPEPAQTLSTLSTFANLTVATHALNFAFFEEQAAISKDYLVMMALGPDMHANAMLLKRG